MWVVYRTFNIIYYIQIIERPFDVLQKGGYSMSEIEALLHYIYTLTQEQVEIVVNHLPELRLLLEETS